MFHQKLLKSRNYIQRNKNREIQEIKGLGQKSGVPYFNRERWNVFYLLKNIMALRVLSFEALEINSFMIIKDFKLTQQDSTQNHLVRKRTFNHLANLITWFVYELNGCGLEPVAVA